MRKEERAGKGSWRENGNKWDDKREIQRCNERTLSVQSVLPGEKYFLVHNASSPICYAS